MKKILLVAVIFTAGLFTNCFGQNVNVNINNQDYSPTKDCDFKINGICSSEDIGGVDISGLEKYDEVGTNSDGNTCYCINLYAVLTNYNEFPVTVLIDFYGDVKQATLRKDETKEIFVSYASSDIKTSYRPPRETGISYKGMIVRKLGK